MRHVRAPIITVIATLVIVAGCSGGGGAAATSGAKASSQPAASAAPPSSEPAASAAPASSQPAASAAASSAPAAGGGKLPGDPCQLVTAADVGSIYGGSVKALGLDENGACPFEIEGKAKAGQSAAAGEFAVSFGDQFSSYDTVKMLFGDGVKKIDGLGTDAYSVGGFTHAKVGAGELVVGGVWVGNYDRALLATETFEMTKLLLGRL
jgi:hypothetical protein